MCSSPDWLNFLTVLSMLWATTGYKMATVADSMTSDADLNCSCPDPTMSMSTAARNIDIEFCIDRSAPALDSIKMLEIDKLIKDVFMPINFIPGFGLAIVTGSNGRSIAKGYGFRNLEDKIKVVPTTVFAVGSNTKPFLAILAVKTLSERYPKMGEAILDVPVRQLVPSAQFYMIDRFRTESVTFRDLLSHRLCLTEELVGLMITQPFKDADEYEYRQRYLFEVCSFRSTFVYNNAGYILAGKLISTITGKPLGQMFAELLDDLGMTDSTYLQDAADYDDPKMSRSYYQNGTRLLKRNPDLLKRATFAIAAGGILSTMKDMIKFIKFELANGKVGTKQLVSVEAMSWLRNVGIAVTPFNGYKTTNLPIVFEGDFGYGLGHTIGTIEGWQRISHSGYIIPFSSELTIYPALNMGIFTVSNGPGIIPSVLMPILHTLIYKILTEPKFSIGVNTTIADFQQRILLEEDTIAEETEEMFYEPTDDEGLSNQNLRKRDTSPSPFIGNYGNAISGELSVTAPTGSQTGDLYLNYGVWGTGPMKAKNSTMYELFIDTDAIQDLYTVGPFRIGNPIVDFSQPNKLILSSPPILGLVLSVEFTRDLTLDKLPTRPWSLGSCAAVPPAST